MYGTDVLGTTTLHDNERVLQQVRDFLTLLCFWSNVTLG